MTKSPCCAPTCCAGPTPERRPEDADAVRAQVRATYAHVARGESTPNQRETSRRLGYSESELGAAPAEANLGVGCGNPTALASLAPGETVLDLGAGAGLDAFIAAERVGSDGRVIGVDMTPEMLARARKNAVQAGVADRVEFREGTIENLPVIDASIDVVISNCVINLSPDKPKVFREAFRVLKSGGRLAVSDIALTEPLPQALLDQASLYAACVSGALVIDEYVAAIEAAGFVDVHVKGTDMAQLLDDFLQDPTLASVATAVKPEELRRAARSVKSYAVEARKP